MSAAWDSKAKLDWDFNHGHLPIGQLILNQLLFHNVELSAFNGQNLQEVEETWRVSSASREPSEATVNGPI